MPSYRSMLDYDMTFFTPVSDFPGCRSFKGLKIIALPAVHLVTLRTIAIPQLIGHDGQVAMPALHFLPLSGEQYEILVVTFRHRLK
jgi:hypothetical protein